MELISSCSGACVVEEELLERVKTGGLAEVLSYSHRPKYQILQHCKLIPI
jgi:hypothetical protein